MLTWSMRSALAGAARVRRSGAVARHWEQLFASGVLMGVLTIGTAAVGQKDAPPASSIVSTTERSMSEPTTGFGVNTRLATTVTDRMAWARHSRPRSRTRCPISKPFDVSSSTPRAAGRAS